MGAKINGKLVPISHQLNNGDQVEIITSSKQKPNEDWLSFVITSRAKEKIKTSLKEEKKKVAEQGKETLIRKLKQLKVQFEERNILFLTNLYKMPSTLDLYYNIALDKIDLSKLKALNNNAGFFEFPKNDIKPAFPKIVETSEDVPQLSKDTELHILGESSDRYAYEFAKCCTPVPGDDVVGFISVNGVVKIHRANCSNAINLMSRFGYRVIKTQWSNKKSSASLTTLNIGGMDDIGLLNKITAILSDDFKINIQSISIESNDGVFNGTVKIFVKDNKELNNIIKKLRNIKSILTVERT
jgi:GTP pyrophosphokinase